MTPPRWLVVASALALVLACSVSSRHLDEDVEHGPHCADIDVASAITLSGDRASALMEIAALHGLSQHEQMFLVDTAVSAGGLSSDLADVLVVLAGNPTLTAEARSYLSERQRDVSLMSSDRERIAKALARVERG